MSTQRRGGRGDGADGHPHRSVPSQGRSPEFARFPSRRRASPPRSWCLTINPHISQILAPQGTSREIVVCQIDLICAPQLMSAEGPLRAPRRILAHRRRRAQVTERDLISDPACDRIADSGLANPT